MSPEVFAHRAGVMHAEGVPLTALAERYGTPCYVYSRAAIEQRWRALDGALSGLPHLLCYAVKANSNLAVLDALARLGSGFDIVSVGELERVLAAGGLASRVVFAGVGKREDEMERALDAGIRCFNVESEPELLRLDAVAGRLGLRAPVALRVNPDVDAGTHPYIATGLRENKFGIAMDEALALYARAAALRHVEPVGVACHIGSQLTSLAPVRDALDRLVRFLDALAAAGLRLRHVDVGGGLGIRYRDEQPPSFEQYAEVVASRLAGRGLEVLLEPGRAIVGPAGVLLTRVEYVKQTPDKAFVVVDAAMNDLIRPALYAAWQDIAPVTPRHDRPARLADVVGPVCETGDFLGKERELAVAPGDLLAVGCAGAYGFVMSSNYNSRPRPAEVMVDGDRTHLVRERETLVSLYAGEHRLP